MASAKLLDALARMHGFDCEDADAMCAYAQVVPGTGRTWDTTSQWCHSRLNLYGDPKAGRYWEQHCAKHILNNGFEKMRGWHNIFQHKAKKLWLSVYVDDFKMVGGKASIGPI